MLGDSAVLGGGGGGGSGERGDAAATASSAAATATATATHEMVVEAAAAAAAVVGGSNSGSDDIGRGERSFGGNRWPRQETLALLEIRSDMDVAFRDASVKGPLWEQVSMKLAELGFHRSAKKCKEKFENVYKYHKRTKDGRTGKSDGKTYRFFDQLEALDHIHSHNQPSTKPPPTSSSPSLVATTTTNIAPAMSIPPVTNTTPNVTIPSTTTPSVLPPIIPPQGITTIPPSESTPNPTNINIPTDLLSNSSSYSSSSSDETLEEGTRKRKQKWKYFFERLMKEVIKKQEELQRKFLEAIEKREQERMVRDEAWRAQEMQRINRERETLAQERSIAAAKDAAVMSLLQKIAEQQNLPQTLLSNINNIVQQQQPNVAPTVLQPPLPQQLPQVVKPLVSKTATAPRAEKPVVVVASQRQQQGASNMEIVKVDDNNVENMIGASSSRWPKVEVNALIKLRTEMDAKYQENGPKGPLWEEISAAMRKLGYNRNPKRCKEKWENINKYFKKVKESNKRRPEDSKTCPYFHQLDVLYREKKSNNNASAAISNSTPVVMKAEDNMQAVTAAAPLMVRPEQQWPPEQKQQEEQRREEEDDMDGEEEEEEEEEEEDEGGGSGSGSGGSNFEIVASKPAVLGGAAAEEE